MREVFASIAAGALAAVLAVVGIGLLLPTDNPEPVTSTKLEWMACVTIWADGSDADLAECDAQYDPAGVYTMP